MIFSFRLCTIASKLKSKVETMMRKMVMAGLAAAVMTTGAFAAKPVTTTVTLGDEQLDSLVFIYQEEKVARDTYENLKAGSLNHLAAFRDAIDAYNNR